MGVSRILYSSSPMVYIHLVISARSTVVLHAQRFRVASVARRARLRCSARGEVVGIVLGVSTRLEHPQERHLGDGGGAETTPFLSAELLRSCIGLDSKEWHGLRTLLGAKGIATRSKDATNGAPGRASKRTLRTEQRSASPTHPSDIAAQPFAGAKQQPAHVIS